MLKLIRKSKNILLLLSIFISSSYFYTTSAIVLEHPHMLGVYLAPSAIEKIGHNVEQILDVNGLSLSNYYHPKIQKRPGKKRLEEIVTDKGTLKSLKKIRYLFRKFFTGLYIRNSHDLEVNIDGIDISGHWKKFNFDVVDIGIESPNKVLVEFKAIADRLKLSVEKATIQDHLHKFLGVIGVNNLTVALESTSEPLERVPLTGISSFPRAGDRRLQCE